MKDENDKVHHSPHSYKHSGVLNIICGVDIENILQLHTEEIPAEIPNQQEHIIIATAGNICNVIFFYQPIEPKRALTVWRKFYHCIGDRRSPFSN